VSLITQMNTAVLNDISSNKQGRPGLEKLKMIETVIKKLKHKEFASIFLDENGLDVINSFICQLPDNSWPLSSVRVKLLDLIYKLPVQVEHLRATKLGRTLAQLQLSKSEFPDNKKLIQLIKDKWSRIICTIPVDYTSLEQCERNFVNIPVFEKVETEEEKVRSKNFVLILDFVEEERGKRGGNELEYELLDHETPENGLQLFG
jgi:hypothetical protein